MIGVLPSGLFGLRQPTVAPVQDVTAAAPAMPSPAFVFGAGGARLTPDVIEQRSKVAQALIANGMDASPVGHWTQGLARLAQGYVGGQQQRSLDRATEANAADGRAALSALGTGGNEQTIASILGSEFVPQGVKDAAKLQWQATHRAPVQPSEFERTAMAAGLTPGTPEWTAANKARLQNYTDPTINIPLPGGRVYVGPRSGIAAATEGGGPASVGPGAAMPPSTLPPDFDFGAGGPTQPASGGFR